MRGSGKGVASKTLNHFRIIQDLKKSEETVKGNSSTMPMGPIGG